ncbi:MAG: ABC transporter ATP-binding protein [Candidatus Acidiferrales bacterium]
MSTAPVIETQNLTKRFRDQEAVSCLNLRVEAQQITGFLGRNGAGKSTTIKMLLGMVHPSAGTGSVLGRAIAEPRENRVVRERIAYVGEDKPLYDYMTVAQLIRFTRTFYKDWRADAEHRLLAQYKLPRYRKIRALSKGMRTKCALLVALARRPELLILDEPSEGLDPVAVEELLQSLIEAAAEGTTVFFSSHQIVEVERIADRACIIDQGRLVADIILDEMRQAYRRITFSFNSAPLEAEFRMQGVESIRTSGRQLTLLASQNSDTIVELGRSLGAISVEVAPVGLRETFLQVVKEER